MEVRVGNMDVGKVSMIERDLTKINEITTISLCTQIHDVYIYIYIYIEIEREREREMM